MKCSNCGATIESGHQFCMTCGTKLTSSGNTEFYARAASSTLTLRDVFSDVFKHHNKTDGERMFMAGTSLSTPSEREMLSEWRKPWLFSWAGGIGFVFILLMYFLAQSGAELYAVVPLVFMGAVIIPLAVLLFFWEMNIPRNIPIYEVISMFLIGGACSLIFTWMMNSVIGEFPAYLAPITEEPAKLMALCIFLRKAKNKYIFNGLLIGAAVGTGFAAIETMGYALRYEDYIGVLINRGIGSIGAHVAWAAMYGGALALVKGSQQLRTEHLKDKRFLQYFALACLLHFLWNSDFGLVAIPLFGDLKYVILIAGAWAALLNLMNKGILQVLRISSSSIVGGDAQATSAPTMLQGVSGMYTAAAFPLTSGKLVFGRDTSKCNIVFPSSAPGISFIHCEVYREAQIISLVDRGSTFGTFLANGTKLKPNKAYILNSGDQFFLADRNNIFQVQ